jgi:hypothetical protein
MNNGWLLIGLMLAGLFLFRRPTNEPGLIGVNTSQPGFGGFDADDPW